MTQNCINTGIVISQILTTSTASVVTCSTALPSDDSIPQNGEGTEVLTLAITPYSATSTLLIEFKSAITTDSSAVTVTTALFQDSTASAIAANSNAFPSSLGGTFSLRHIMTSGTTSSTTFKIRVGPSANTVYVNGNASGTRRMGGVSETRLTITEFI